MTCPHCAEPLVERGVFCKACAGQARCMKCRELLEPGAIACVECGTRIGQSVEAATGTASHPALTVTMQPNRNTLSYQEDRNSRRFEASLTDSAMHGLGDVFGELFARAGTTRVVQPNGAHTLSKDVIIDDAKHLPPAPPTNEDHQAVSTVTTTPQPTTDMDRILKIFAMNGDALELIDNRLKATTAADYYKRLTYLFLYAHELHGHTTAPKAELVTVLKEAKVYDPNCRTWLKQKKGFNVDGEDRLKLIAGSREQAKKTLDEALDPNVSDEWNPDNRVTKARGPRKKKA
jgi:hypothetical protein